MPKMRKRKCHYLNAAGGRENQKARCWIKHGVGFGGHMNNAARGLTAVCTLGMSNLVWKKSKGTEKTKFENQKVCLCQNCGSSWTIE